MFPKGTSINYFPFFSSYNFFYINRIPKYTSIDTHHIILYWLGPGFVYDSNTAHTEREISGNGRMLKSDITTLKKNTTRRVKKCKG